MEEQWKPVIGYEDFYLVSNLGRVKSLYRNIIMNPTLHVKTGYYQVGLRKPNSKRKTVSVHRIVAEVFCKKGQGKNVVNHLNGKKTDNRAINLEWTTKSENEKHAVKLGLRSDCVGERNFSNKLKEDQVRKIIKNPNNKTQKELAKEFGVTQSCISNIFTGKAWSHVTDGVL